MVGISLYRGNLHKVPDDAPPRRWTTPKPTISPKHFQTLLRRRSKALSGLLSTAPIPNPNPTPELKNNSDNIDQSEINLLHSKNLQEKEEERVKGEDAVKESVNKDEENVKDVEKNDFPSELEAEAGSNTETSVTDKEKRKKEIKERLEILNEKKHSLVQVLKQILNAEGQLKRQNSTQGNSGRPPLPLQVETTAIDSGSITRINTPRVGSDGNPFSQINGGEADDDSTPNLQSRQLSHVNSTSPLSDSQHLRPVSNMMPHSYRTTMAVAGSPSRFAPTTGQGQGPPSVSASGTNYIASSPSPAASGGTSVFRDVRLPSPLN